MQTVLMYVLFVVGLVLIIKGGDWFVDSASWIAEILGVPKFVIGATIVSVATTLPEMIVSIQATAKGNVDMAAGNAIGSVTANTAMIMGIFIVCMPFAIKRKEFAPKGIMMFLASVALVVGCIFTSKQSLTFEGETNDYYSLSTVGLIVLIIVFVVFFVENFLSMKHETHHIEPSPSNIGLQEEDDIVPTKETATGKDWAKNIAFFVLGAAGIVIGADLLVDRDGEKELAVLSPFHGDKICIYKKKEEGFEKAYEYEKPAEFTHAIYGGSLCGKQALIVGHRKAERNLIVFWWDEKKGYCHELIDRDCGSANVFHYVDEGKDILISANREIDEIAMYTLEW